MCAVVLGLNDKESAQLTAGRVSKPESGGGNLKNPIIYEP